MLRARILVVALLMSLTSIACRADEIIDWNNVTLDAIRANSTPPPRATRILAMVHCAMFDAVNGIDRSYEPYLVQQQAPSWSSGEAAAATAAFIVLRNEFPGMKSQLSVRYLVSISSIETTFFSRLSGIVFGYYCGVRMLDDREGDGADATVLYIPSGIPGFWQPTPPAFAPALLPQWPNVKPFAIPAGDAFRVPSPPSFTSTQYARDFREVKVLGDIDSVVRTPDQTIIAYFWEDGAGTVTPPGHWHVIAQQLSERFGLSLEQNARLFALLGLAQADGAICCWDNKYFWDHVRPYTAITMEADEDGNPRTSEDADWFNLIPTPPFPAYTSGHSTFSGGSSRLLELFLGTDAIAFSGASPDPQRWPDVLPGVVRSWSSLSQAAEEAGQSRIYGGIHWQYDNQLGLSSGRAIAQFVFENFLRPVE